MKDNIVCRTLLLSILMGLAMIGAMEVAHAAIYGVRTKNPGTPEQETIRWRTTAESVELEVPNHGTVTVFVQGEELFVQANGDAQGSRLVTIKALVSNQVRLGFSK